MMISILWQWLPMMCQNALTSQRPSSGVLFQCSQTPRENDQAGLITKLQCQQGPKSGRNVILHPLHPPSLSFSWVWHRTKSEGLPSPPPSLISFFLLSLFSLPMTPASSLASLMALTEGLSTSLGLTCTKEMLRGLTFALSEGSPLNFCLLCERIDNTAVSHNFTKYHIMSNNMGIEARFQPCRQEWSSHCPQGRKPAKPDKMYKKVPTFE